MENDKVLDAKQSTERFLDKIKCRNSRGIDYWHARDLQGLLGYAKWDNFKSAIEKARMACNSVGNNAVNHFADIRKMVNIGSGTQRDIDDIALTRYACYLIAMNGDPAKPEIAAAQTYFAIQTRKQELTKQYDEVEDRLMLRDRVKDANKDLNSAANEVGVHNYAYFHDAGYKGLYGGLKLSEIKGVKGIEPKENLLDRAGRAELAANEFRITQTELKLRNEQINGQKEAENVHHYVGKEVRQAIEKLSGTMPEDLPIEAPIKQLKKQGKRKELPPTS